MHGCEDVCGGLTEMTCSHGVAFYPLKTGPVRLSRNNAQDFLIMRGIWETMVEC